MRSIKLALHVAVASLLAAGHASAQTIMSFRAGATVASLDGDGIVDSDSRTGLQIGAGLTFAVSSAAGVQAGASYVQKGATFREDEFNGTIGLDYIEIPVLLVIGVPTDGVVSPHFSVGPAVAFEVDCSLDLSSLGVTASVGCETGQIETRSVDFGAMAGVGVDIAASQSMAITFDVGYTHGFTSLDDSEEPDDLKNRAWSFLAGVSFPFGR